MVRKVERELTKGVQGAERTEQVELTVQSKKEKNL